MRNGDGSKRFLFPKFLVEPPSPSPSSFLMKVAVLVDGAFFLKRVSKLIPNFEWDAERTANLTVSYCMRHVEHDADKQSLYRIFFYDCPPLAKKLHTPISNKAIDYAKRDQSVFRNALFEELRKKRKVALRLGYLAGRVGWVPKDEVMKDLIKGKRNWETLADDDFRYALQQKGVDSRIAVDIASLSFKKQVDQIILVAGDADFVPAAKLARREGIDFILDPLHNHIDPSLHEHIDGCHSKGFGPKKKPNIGKQG